MSGPTNHPGSSHTPHGKPATTVRRSSVVLLALLAITVSAATVMLAMQDRTPEIDPSVLAAEATVDARLGGSALPEPREGLPERVDRRALQKP